MNHMYSRVTTLIALVLAVAACTSAALSYRKMLAARAEVIQLREQSAVIKPSIPATRKTASTATSTLTNGSDRAALLQAEIAQLKAQLVEKDKPRRSRQQRWEDRMARMKEEDPEQYQELIQRRMERQERVQYGMAERTAVFMDLDTAGMSEEERVSHELLVQNMADIWALTDRFSDPEASPDPETQMELNELVKETRPLMKTERDIMLRQLAGEYGYEGSDAEVFSAYVKEILDATTLNIPRNMRGNGGKGSGRGN